MFGRPKGEIDLLEAGLRGNAQAFGTVVERYASLVCAITYSATGNATESEELAQETFLRAWKGLGQLKDLSKFRPWLCGIARSTVQNWFRGRKRDVVAQATPLETATDRTSDKFGPVETAMTREQQAVVSQALAQIPENLREPLILFYREQQSTRQVARQLGLSENAARQRISRGRAMLRTQVERLVETTIAQTKPGKAFKTAVIAAIAASTVTRSTSATALAHASSSGSGLGAGTALSSLAGKIALAAAALAVVAGAVWMQSQTGPSVNTDATTTSMRTVSPEQPEPSESTLPALASLATRTIPNTEETPTATASPSAPTPAVTAEEAPATTQPDAESAPFEFTPRGILSGIVTDVETGQPVSDALVRITRNRIFDTRTDARGFYSFEEIHEAGNFTIAVDSKDYVGIPWDRNCPIIALSKDKQAVRHFQFPKACMVDLWVVDANGVGIADAKVLATVPTKGSEREVSRFGSTRQTGPDGYILLGGFPPSETDYQIAAWHTNDSRIWLSDGSRHLRRTYDSSPACTLVRLTDPNRIAQVRIVLEEGQDVHGYAEYADRVPASDVEIVARPSWCPPLRSIAGYPVNADGTFTIKHITPGQYDVCAHIRQADFTGGRTKTIAQMQLPRADGEPLLLRLPDKSPQSLASISGTFVFLSEKKPERVDIDAYSPSAGHRHATVGCKANGEVKDTFLIDRLEPGTYRLSFTGDEIEAKVVEAVAAPSCDLEVELVYAMKPTLKGTVIDARTGAPVPSFQARVRKLRTLRGPNYGQENQWTQFDDERGYFSVEAVGPGVYQVQVAADGYAPIWSVEIGTDANDLVEVALVRGGTVVGTVVDDEGRAVTGACVVPLSLAGGMMGNTKDRFVSEQGAVETVDGTFALNHLPPGTETLKVTHPDYAVRVVRDLEVTDEQTTPGVEIVLTPGGTVEGTVYGDQGIPLAGEMLHFQDARAYGSSTAEKAGRLASVVTDSNGFYRVSHLPEQLCYVKRDDEWRSLGVVRRTVVPGNRTVSRVDFGGTPTVTGTVVLQDAPLAKTRLLLGAVETPHFGPSKSYTMTDEYGTFVFAGVAPGTHALYREDPDRKNNWLRIATVTIQDLNVNIGTVDGRAQQLRITFETPDGTVPWQIADLFLGDVGKPFPAPRYAGKAPAQTEQPWTFANIEGGAYMLLARRQDQVQWQTEIALEEEQSTWELSVPIPESTSSVSGHITGATGKPLILWRHEKDILGVITPDPNGCFGIDDLPAGDYVIGSTLAFLYDTPALTELRLDPHAHQTVDLDLSASPLEEIAYLTVQVVDESGITRDDATVLLEGALGLIEPISSTQLGYVFIATPGRHRLDVELPGHRRIEKDITLQAIPAEAGEPQTLRIVVKPL